MKISKLQTGANFSFKRTLTPLEKIQARVAIQESKKQMGIEHIDLVTHTQSLPSFKDEDTGIGVWAPSAGTKSYIDFAYENGIDGILIEPAGVISPPLYSPYDSSAYSKKMAVDLKELTTEKWGKLLPYEVFESVVQNKNYEVVVPENPNSKEKDGKTIVKTFEPDQVIYDYALPAQYKAVEVAYDNMIQNQNDEKISSIQKDFEQFKTKNASWLDNDAIYYVLYQTHGDFDYENWENELDKVLMDKSDTRFSDEEKEKRLDEIKTNHKKDLEVYKFMQFVVNSQQKEIADYASNISKIKLQEERDILAKAYVDKIISHETFAKLFDANEANTKGVSIIADKPIGFSSMDIWGNPQIFTKDEFVGAPPDVFSADGQAWGFKFIPREKMFNEDGSLAEGGKYLKNLYTKTFEENLGGVRIDHVLGLIDPWTYKENPKGAMGGSRYLFKTMLNGELKELQKFGFNEETILGVPDPINGILEKNSENRKLLKEKGISDFDGAKKVLLKNIDNVKAQYSKMLTDIVLPAGREVVSKRAEEKGEKLSPEELNKEVASLLIAEDMGVLTTPLTWVMKDLGLFGMRHARYSDPYNKKHIYRECNKAEQGHYWMVGTHDDDIYLNQVKSYDNKEAKAHAKYLTSELGISKKPLMEMNNPWIVAKAKIARLFLGDKNPKTPNNIILNWLDVFNSKHRYNTPGILDKSLNWNRRIPNETPYDEKYYNETLPNGEGISVAESLKMAMEAMDGKFRKENKELIQTLSETIDKLNEKPN